MCGVELLILKSRRDIEKGEVNVGLNICGIFYEGIGVWSKLKMSLV